MRLVGGYKKPRPRRIFYVNTHSFRVKYSLDSWEVPETRHGLAVRVRNWRRRAEADGCPGATKVVSQGRQYMLHDHLAPTFFPRGVPRKLLDRMNKG